MRRRWLYLSGVIGFAAALVVALQIGGDSKPEAQIGENGISVPSGQVITLLDVIHGQQGVDGLTVRFRFVAPSIGAGDKALKFEDVEGDMKYLCETYAVPRISSLGPKPSQIVISLSDRPMTYGSTEPDVIQYFEAYSVDDGACQWEVF